MADMAWSEQDHCMHYPFYLGRLLQQHLQRQSGEIGVIMITQIKDGLASFAERGLQLWH